MNIIVKLALACILFCSISCSSDSEEKTESTFKISVNGEDFTQEGFDPRFITKTEDVFLLKIYTNYGQIFCSFNKSGKFGYFNIDRQTGDPTITSLFYSAYFNTSDNLTFELVSMDEVHKRVKGIYSGYLYSDPYNINSEKKYVSGEFDVRYEDNVPSVFGLTNKCKINGNDWVRSNKYAEKNIGGINVNVAQHDFNGDIYEIITSYNFVTIAPGSYNFTSSDVTQKVEIAKYDSATGIRTVYNSTGTLTINSKSGGILTGVYNFTAVNPNNAADVIQVTDGAIKAVLIN